MAHRDVNALAPNNFNLGLTDSELASISAKELNVMLKQSDLTAQQTADLKLKKRTLRNRGYAAESRKAREDREAELRAEIKQIEDNTEDLKIKIAQLVVKKDILLKAIEEQEKILQTLP